MNRKSFMAELRSLLAFLDAAERERVLNRYERMFDEAGPEGEAAVIRCFGSPVRQVLQIEREYRDAVANGETPFADGEITAEPEETEAVFKEAAEEAADTETEPEEAEPEEELLPEEPADEPIEEPLTETAEIVEEIVTEPEPVIPEPPVFSVLPELNLDGLDLPELDLSLPEEPAVTEPEPEPVAEPEEPEEEPVEPELPEAEPPADEMIGEIILEAAEALSEEPADEPSEETLEAEEPAVPEEPEAVPAESDTEEPDAEEPAEPETPEEPEETAAPEEPEEIVLSAEPDEPETAPVPAAEPSGDGGEEEYYYEEIEERPRVSGGRAFAAVVVTIPMLVLWAVLFGLSLGLGLAVLAVGAALCMVGVYLTGYVFGGAIGYMPDLLLTAGATLASFALSLLLLWAGVSIAVSGCTLTVRLTRSIYRSILYPKKGANCDE